MGSNKTPTDMRGLLIPDPRFRFEGGFDVDGSSFTENTARPGVPVAKNDSDLIVETSGTTTSADKYTLYTQNSGYPENLGGTFLHYDTSSTDTHKYFGWEPPHTINGLERVKTGDSSNHFVNYDICTTANDTIIVAGLEKSDGELKTWTRKPDSLSWTESTPPFFLEPGMQKVVGNRFIDATDGGKLTGTAPSPAPCVLPSGRVLCFYWIQTAVETTATSADSSITHWQIQAVFTDDHGTNWSMYQNFCLNEPFSQKVDTCAIVPGTDTTGRFYPGRLRAAYKDGQILLISSAYDNSSDSSQGAPAAPGNVYAQWASSSLGASFVQVEIDDRAANSAAHYDIAVSGGQFVISYLQMGSTGAIPYIAKLGSAFTPLTRADTSFVSVDTYGRDFAQLLGTGFGYAVGRADLSICAVPDGSMYLVGVRHGDQSAGGTRNSVALMHSGDHGTTWSLVGGEWSNTTGKKDGTIYSPRFHDEPSDSGALARDTFRNVAITWQRGRLVVACRYVSSPETGGKFTDGTPDYDVSCLYLGGYSNFTIGSIDAAVDMADRGTYCRNWLPFIEPSEMSGAWTRTTSGAISEGIILNGIMPAYKIDTTGGTRCYEVAELNHTNVRNTRSSSDSWGGPMRTYAEFCVEAVSGGSQIDSLIAFEMTNGNVDAKTRAAVLLQRSGDVTVVAVRDVVADTMLGFQSIQATTTDKIFEYRMAIIDRKVAVWYRQYDPYKTRRKWTKLYESATQELTPQEAATGYCSIKFGAIDTGTATANWYKVQAGAHDGDRSDCAVPRLNDWLGYVSPRNVGGRFYSTSNIYLNNGLQIATKDGPAVKGEQWDLIPRHDYPVKAMHYEIAPSPSKKWVSNGRTATTLVWKLDENDPSLALGGLRALYLGGINFRWAVLYGFIEGGGNRQLATIDAAQPVNYQRKGNTVTARFTPAPTTAQTGTIYYHFNDLAGCTFNFEDTSTPDLALIASSSEGVFESGNARSPVLILDGDLSSKPSAGNGQIWAKDILVVLPEAHDEPYKKITLEIGLDVPLVSGTDDNKTETNNFEIGVAMWGHVAVFGNQYSNGHIRSLQTNTELFTAPGGQRRAVKRGPTRRTVEFSWQDPIDISQIADVNPSPDYLEIRSDGAAGTFAGPAKVASKGDTPFLVHGLLSRLEGSMIPVVYIPKIPASIEEAYTIRDRNRFLYGRITSAEHRIENQIGDEWTGNNEGETVTATAIRIEEEL